MKQILILDIETTGLDEEKDEILSLSIIDVNENVLYYSYFRPLNVKEWVDAGKIHHIGWKQVYNAPTFPEELDTINDVLASASLIVGYNLEIFDLPFLKNKGVIVPDVPVVDVMECFAGIYGDWNDIHGQFRCKKLVDCATYYGYEFKAHESLEDVKATLYCYKQMIDKANQVSKEHFSAYFDGWQHGNVISYTRDRDRNHIIEYEDGSWWHYLENGKEWW